MANFNSSLLKILSSGRCAELPEPAFQVYCYIRLRAECNPDKRTKEFWDAHKIVAAFDSVHRIATMLGYTKPQVESAIDFLVKRGWIMGVIGDGYAVSSALNVQGIEGLLVYAEVSTHNHTCPVSKVSEEIIKPGAKNARIEPAKYEDDQDRLLSQMPKKTIGTRLARHFSGRYKLLHGRYYPGIEENIHPKNAKSGENLFEIFGSVKKAEKFIDFACENWPTIVGLNRSINAPRVSWGLITNNEFAAKIIGYMEDGFPVKKNDLSDRSKTDWASQKDGW